MNSQAKVVKKVCETLAVETVETTRFTESVVLTMAVPGVSSGGGAGLVEAQELTGNN